MSIDPKGTVWTTRPRTISSEIPTNRMRIFGTSKGWCPFHDGEHERSSGTLLGDQGARFGMALGTRRLAKRTQRFCSRRIPTCRARGSKGSVPIEPKGKEYEGKVARLREAGVQVYDVGPEILGEGSYGPEVTELQKYLDRDGFYQYPEYTGYFGPLTKQAVMRWQIEQGITPTGNFGVKSLARYLELMDQEAQSKQEVKESKPEGNAWMFGKGKKQVTKTETKIPSNVGQSPSTKWPVSLAVVAIVASLLPLIYRKLRSAADERLAREARREHDRLRQLNRWNATINVDRSGGPRPVVPSRKSIAELGRESSSFDSEDLSGSF